MYVLTIIYIYTQSFQQLVASHPPSHYPPHMQTCAISTAYNSALSERPALYYYEEMVCHCIYWRIKDGINSFAVSINCQRVRCNFNHIH